MKKLWILTFILFFSFLLSLVCFPQYVKWVLKSDEDFIYTLLKSHPKKYLDSFQSSMMTLKENELRQSEQNQEEAILKSSKITLRSSELVRGQAPIQVIVYSDLTCYYCKKVFLETLAPLLQENKIEFIFRHAPSQNGLKFSEYFEALRLENPQLAIQFHDEILKAKNLDSVFTKLKITQNQLEQWVKKHQKSIDQKIEEDLQMAQNDHLQGTPLLLVNNVRVDGFIKKEALEHLINKIYEKK